MKAFHDVHVQNYLSENCTDNVATAASYIERAAQMGLKVLGFANCVWDASVSGANYWYNKHGLTYSMQIRSQIPEDTKGVKVLVGGECEYCGMSDTLGMTAQGAKQLDFLLVPHSHVQMRNFVMPDPPEVTAARAKLKKIIQNKIEHISDERAQNLSEKIFEEELGPFMDGPVGDYPAYLADFMVHSFRGLMENKELGQIVASTPVAVAHPFCAIGSDAYAVAAIEKISEDTFAQLFSMAASRNVGLEINAKYGSDAMRRMLQIAKDQGCKFVLGSDAQSRAQCYDIVKVEPMVSALGLTEYDFMDFVRI